MSSKRTARTAAYQAFPHMPGIPVADEHGRVFGNAGLAAIANGGSRTNGYHWLRNGRLRFATPAEAAKFVADQLAGRS